MHGPTTLTIEERSGGLMVARFVGDLDSAGTRTIQDAFTAMLASPGTHVVVDLSRVSFMSSAGVAMLLVKGKQLRQAGGRLCIAAPTPRVAEVLALAGLHELFDIYPTLESACTALEA